MKSMMFDGINLIGVLAAAIAAFVFGAAWYGVLGKAWIKAANLSEAQRKPLPATLAITFVCQLLMAFVLAGVILHVGGPSLKAGLISGSLIWVGFILTTQIVNHRFQAMPWCLTFIDAGHWLGVLLIQGSLIGLIG